MNGRKYAVIIPAIAITGIVTALILQHTGHYILSGETLLAIGFLVGISTTWICKNKQP